MNTNHEVADTEDHWYTIGQDNRLVFTILGLRELGEYFRKAGIEISSITTLAEYIEARKTAAPYFKDHLIDIARGQQGAPKTMERDALMAIAIGDTHQFTVLHGKLEKRKALGLKRVK